VPAQLRLHDRVAQAPRHVETRVDGRVCQGAEEGAAYGE
jgi:hypothetical protein